MASIYSDEMRENILADFSSKNPKVSASIIERFGENPRSKGLGALEAEQYRAAVDAPLYATNGTTGGVSSAGGGGGGSAGGGGTFTFMGQQLSFPDILDLLTNIMALKNADVETPIKAPRYNPPKSIQLEGIGGIGMNDGGTVLNRKLFLGGGEVDGMGGPKSDLVPIWASDQEYVVSANGVKRMGGGNHSRGIAALDEVNNNGRLV
tara:strand:+ start:1449 stop:2069 length:621 start_codon:yes stop_codon:yes gene_type:complete